MATLARPCRRPGWRRADFAPFKYEFQGLVYVKNTLLTPYLAIGSDLLPSRTHAFFYVLDAQFYVHPDPISPPMCSFVPM